MWRGHQGDGDGVLAEPGIHPSRRGQTPQGPHGRYGEEYGQGHLPDQQPVPHAHRGTGSPHTSLVEDRGDPYARRLQGRTDPHQETRQKRDPECNQEDGHIEPRVDRDGRRELFPDAEDGLRKDDRQGNAQSTAEQGQDGRLGQESSDQAASARSKGQADRQLGPQPLAPGKEEAGQVQAGKDKEDDEYAAGQLRDRSDDSREGRVNRRDRGGHHLEPAAGMGAGVGGEEFVGEVSDCRLRIGQRRSVRHSAHDVECVEQS